MILEQTIYLIFFLCMKVDYLSGPVMKLNLSSPLRVLKITLIDKSLITFIDKKTMRIIWKFAFIKEPTFFGSLGKCLKFCVAKLLIFYMRSCGVSLLISDLSLFLHGSYNCDLSNCSESWTRNYFRTQNGNVELWNPEFNWIIDLLRIKFKFVIIADKKKIQKSQSGKLIKFQSKVLSISF